MQALLAGILKAIGVDLFKELLAKVVPFVKEQLAKYAHNRDVKNRNKEDAKDIRDALDQIDRKNAASDIADITKRRR